MFHPINQQWTVDKFNMVCRGEESVAKRTQFRQVESPTDKTKPGCVAFELPLPLVPVTHEKRHSRWSDWPIEIKPRMTQL